MATNSNSNLANNRETATAQVPRINWGWFLLRGVLAIALGVVALLYPLTAVLAFTMVFAAFAFANGLFSIISGIKGARHNEDRWWALVLSGVVGVAVGVIFLAMPALTTVTYAIVNLAIIAAWSIMTGVLELMAAFRLRKEIVGEWLLDSPAFCRSRWGLSSC